MLLLFKVFDLVACIFKVQKMNGEQRDIWWNERCVLLMFMGALILVKQLEHAYKSWYFHCFYLKYQAALMKNNLDIFIVKYFYLLFDILSKQMILSPLFFKK